eukprot:3859614-Pleurochrysis_carterae.AAC.1
MQRAGARQLNSLTASCKDRAAKCTFNDITEIDNLPLGIQLGQGLVLFCPGPARKQDASET